MYFASGALVVSGAAIMLDARGAQAGQAVLVDRLAPRFELFLGEPIALARLFEREQAAAHGGDNFRLAADHPAGRARRRQIVQREGIPVRTHHHPIVSALLLHAPFSPRSWPPY